MRTVPRAAKLADGWWLAATALLACLVAGIALDVVACSAGDAVAVTAAASMSAPVRARVLPVQRATHVASSCQPGALRVDAATTLPEPAERTGTGDLLTRLSVLRI